MINSEFRLNDRFGIAFEKADDLGEMFVFWLPLLIVVAMGFSC